MVALACMVTFLHHHCTWFYTPRTVPLCKKDETRVCGFIILSERLVFSARDPHGDVRSQFTVPRILVHPHVSVRTLPVQHVLFLLREKNTAD